MAQRSLNMASGAPKTPGPGILAASSPNINLSTNMVSEAMSEQLILKLFWGSMPPDPPSACVSTHTPSSVPPPPNRKYLPPPMDYMISSSSSSSCWRACSNRTPHQVVCIVFKEIVQLLISNKANTGLVKTTQQVQSVFEY